MQVKKRDGRIIDVTMGYILEVGDQPLLPQRLMDNNTIKDISSGTVHDARGNVAGHRPGYLLVGGPGANIDRALRAAADATYEHKCGVLAAAWANRRTG